MSGVHLDCGLYAERGPRVPRRADRAGYKTDGIFEFCGIPYATAPTGPNRYKNPSLRSGFYCRILRYILDSMYALAVNTPFCSLVIQITINYRLKAHGFLCLGTESAPGNAEMKDQVARLRWVKKNNANIGGNPDDVTIVGGSAGSSAVDLLSYLKWQTVFTIK
ncbi:hypothetical protein MSG28_009859 [Choristoneura fumiferana]|uniref:Uncharacterized protein n=1 Tax=Choristoneura fumiferana TaxID=7141 RepID=A0ACC0JD06_CHOFU|nr:hypothetical protein MSG28_009859 [Choristoneura fumiferana]